MCLSKHERVRGSWSIIQWIRNASLTSVIECVREAGGKGAQLFSLPNFTCDPRVVGRHLQVTCPCMSVYVCSVHIAHLNVHVVASRVAKEAATWILAVTVIAVACEVGKSQYLHTDSKQHTYVHVQSQRLCFLLCTSSHRPTDWRIFLPIMMMSSCLNSPRLIVK